MHNIKIGSKSYQAPSGWEELDQRALFLVAIYDQYINDSEILAKRFIRGLFNVPSKVFKSLKLSQIRQLYPLIYWLLERNTITNWLIPTIQGGTYIWKGPKNRLANLTADQFCYAELAYQTWLNTGNMQSLDTLIAVLYRRYFFFGLIAEKFNPSKLAARQKDAFYIKSYVKKAIALNYAGCRNLIIEKHPHIWKVALETGDHEGTAAPATSWAGLILDLAGDKFGTYGQTMKEKIWIVLADMDKKAKHFEEMEALNP